MNTYNFFRLVTFDISYLESINKLLSQLTSSEVKLNEIDLKEILKSDSTELYFMAYGDEIIGMFTLGFYITPTGRKCWLEDVVIDSAYRGKSLGKVLMQEVKDIVVGKGNITLMLTSKPSRVAANRLYQGSGFDIKETNVYVKFFD